MTEVEAKSTECETSNKNCFTCSRLDQTPWGQNQEPHSKAVTTEETSQSFRHIGEDYGTTAKDQSGDKSCYKVSPLDSVADRRMHDINYQDGCRQTCQIGGGQEDMEPFGLDPNECVGKAS